MSASREKACCISCPVTGLESCESSVTQLTQVQNLFAEDDWSLVQDHLAKLSAAKAARQFVQKARKAADHAEKTGEIPEDFVSQYSGEMYTATEVC